MRSCIGGIFGEDGGVADAGADDGDEDSGDGHAGDGEGEDFPGGRLGRVVAVVVCGDAAPAGGGGEADRHEAEEGAG